VKSEQFIELVKKPSKLDQSTLEVLKEMIADYPYSPLPRVLYLINLKLINSYKLEQELKKHAIYIPDRALLYRMLNTDYLLEDDFELLPYNPESDLTNKRVKDFERAKGNNEIFDLTPVEFFQLIENEDQKSMIDPSGKKDLIDEFIEKINLGSNATITDVSRQVPENKNIEADSDEFITETLAKVYLKQGLYFEALRSYEKLSLKFPEKNSYFATQIDNIKELISKE
jgi:tetratricopeptide (TPR) repeat protein